jgi:hypothetical protein
MFDDGNHDDGAAGDGIFGILLNMTTASIQYYIYAENAQAGTFSPVRAEFEYYTLLANIQSPVLGDIVINEFVAQNVNGETDEAGEHEDWIELYNNSAQNISLNGIFISDDYGNPFKYAFSASNYIPAHSWLTLWADQDISSTSIHLNFKLGFGGEEIILSAADGTVLDSISFGVQTADVSMARCPDGTGDFATMTPTFGYNNCPISVDEQAINFIFDIYPNPSNEEFYIRSEDIPRSQIVNVYNPMGQLIYQNQLNQGKLEINTREWAGGLYTVALNGFNRKVSVVH